MCRKGYVGNLLKRTDAKTIKLMFPIDEDAKNATELGMGIEV